MLFLCLFMSSRSFLDSDQDDARFRHYKVKKNSWVWSSYISFFCCLCLFDTYLIRSSTHTSWILVWTLKLPCHKQKIVADCIVIDNLEMKKISTWWFYLQSSCNSCPNFSLRIKWDKYSLLMFGKVGNGAKNEGDNYILYMWLRLREWLSVCVDDCGSLMIHCPAAYIIIRSSFLSRSAGPIPIDQVSS